jgi:hypothetical protein
MNVKKTLWSHLRGWFPQEPKILTNTSRATPKLPLTRRYWGLGILTALFWISGVAGIFSAAGHLFQLSYLQVNVQLVMFIVTVLDCVGMFIVGAGLLTAKRRWVDITIIFCVLSLVIFYLIPLRPAFPLEIIAIAYLVYVRQVTLAKPILTKLPALAMVAVVALALFVPLSSPGAQLSSIPNTSGDLVVARGGQISDNHVFLSNVTIYQIPDQDPKKDYYTVEATVVCLNRNLNSVTANISISPQENTVIGYNHKPLASPAGTTQIGLGASTFYIGNYRTSYVYTSQSTISWAEKTVNLSDGEVFLTEVWVPNGTHFAVSFWANAGLKDEIFGTLWADNVTVEGIEV